ncbi:MAG: segregation/condensation protein A [Bacilli bacterium]|nr:segregation/condensation protein A [Bacilli bacterium]
MDYSIKINEFEGPLDLLLHLIKQSNIDIYDIEISEITKQYLDYINKMEELNINVASSYIVMAAELMEIKSKSLLPKKEDEEETDEEEVVSKENLINKLIEYQKYKEMTSSFKELEVARQNIYIKSPEKLNNYIEEVVVKNEDTTIDDLVDAFKKFLDRKNLEKPITTKITNKEYSVKERKHNIKNILKEKKKVFFTELFEEFNTSFIIVTFLSILEMTKEKEIIIKQDTNFSDITIELKVKE